MNVSFPYDDTQTVGLDLETCPIGDADLSAGARRRLEQQIRHHRKRSPDLEDAEVARMARSLHPLLGRICCISIATPTTDGPAAAQSWWAERAEEEPEMLSSFWTHVSRLPHRALWITFNGKRFDAPFLAMRSLHHGVKPTRHDLLDTHPFRQTPHTDLMNLWDIPYSLEDLCDLLHIPSPKGTHNGSHIVRLLAEGRMEDVVRYCEGDALATHACYSQIAKIAATPAHSAAQPDTNSASPKQ